MLNSLVIAFAMYSKIPMPKVEWKEKNMSYSLCFFPLVGVVTGLLELFCFHVLKYLSAGKIMTAAFMTVLPILLNGGIHMDGFLDTVDAKSSWKPAEERLKILKDPHTGAFAIIYGIVYLLAVFGLYTEITEKGLQLLAVGFVYERVLSGLSVAALKKAKKDGMAAKSADAANKNVKWIMGAELAVCGAVFLLLQPVYGGLCMVTGLLCFFYYRHMAYKLFGGVTGDLAGWFLQVCELFLMLALFLSEKMGELLQLQLW